MGKLLHLFMLKSLIGVMGYPGLSWVSGSDEKGQDSAGLALSFLPAGFLALSTQPLPFRSQNRHWALGTQEFSLQSAKDWPPS